MTFLVVFYRRRIAFGGLTPWHLHAEQKRAPSQFTSRQTVTSARTNFLAPLAVLNHFDLLWSQSAFHRARGRRS